MSVPSPTLQFHTALLPSRKRKGKLRVEVIRELHSIGALHLALGNFRVPDMVQVRRINIISVVWIAPEIFYRNAVPTPIAIRCCVQRLVQVPNEVNDEAQRRGALCPRSGF